MNNIRIQYVCEYFITNPLTGAVTNECGLDLTYLCCPSPLWGSLCYCGSVAAPSIQRVMIPNVLFRRCRYLDFHFCSVSGCFCTSANGNIREIPKEN